MENINYLDKNFLSKLSIIEVWRNGKVTKKIPGETFKTFWLNYDRELLVEKGNIDRGQFAPDQYSVPEMIDLFESQIKSFLRKDEDFFMYHTWGGYPDPRKYQIMTREGKVLKTFYRELYTDEIWTR